MLMLVREMSRCFSKAQGVLGKAYVEREREREKEGAKERRSKGHDVMASTHPWKCQHFKNQ
jgi:hypothetical protein